MREIDEEIRPRIIGPGFGASSIQRQSGEEDGQEPGLSQRLHICEAKSRGQLIAPDSHHHRA